jgi:putative ABC transport system ATP-binding protein
MLIDVSDLEAGYAGRTVVNIPALSIGVGENTLLLGPSGSGKTTLLNLLAALTVPTRGRVVIDGQAIGTMRAASRLSAAARDQFRGSRIGLVMQRLHLMSALTVEQNLTLAMRLAGQAPDAARARALLTTLGVGDKSQVFPHRLSQGEAQRVAIARAVIHRPILVLADEPTSALDDANCEAAIELLLTHAREHGATLVVATHDARLKPHFSRVLQLEKT